MLLAVDVGNTQTHLGAFDGERLVQHWRFQTRSGANGDELAERIAGLFSLCGMSFEEIDAVCVSSVVPPLGSQFEELARRYLDAGCLTIGPGVKTGMPIRIENPLEVGADRLVYGSDRPVAEPPPLGALGPSVAHALSEANPERLLSLDPVTA